MRLAQNAVIDLALARRSTGAGDRTERSTLVQQRSQRGHADARPRTVEEIPAGHRFDVFADRVHRSFSLFVADSMRTRMCDLGWLGSASSPPPVLRGSGG